MSANDRTVFVVLGAYHNYSDSSWWVTRVFTEKEAADAFAATLNEVIDVTKKRVDLANPQRGQALGEATFYKWIDWSTAEWLRARARLIEIGESAAHVADSGETDQLSWEVVEAPMTGSSK